MGKKIIITESQLKKIISEQGSDKGINQDVPPPPDQPELHNRDEFSGELEIKDGSGFVGYHRISVGIKDNYRMDSMDFNVDDNGEISVYQEMGYPPEKIQQGKELVKQYIEKMGERLPSGFTWFNLDNPCSDLDVWQCD